MMRRRRMNACQSFVSASGAAHACRTAIDKETTSLRWSSAAMASGEKSFPRKAEGAFRIINCASSLSSGKSGRNSANLCLRWSMARFSTGRLARDRRNSSSRRFGSFARLSFPGNCATIVSSSILAGTRLHIRRYAKQEQILKGAQDADRKAIPRERGRRRATTQPVDDLGLDEAR